MSDPREHIEDIAGSLSDKFKVGAAIVLVLCVVALIGIVKCVYQIEALERVIVMPVKYEVGMIVNGYEILDIVRRKLGKFSRTYVNARCTKCGFIYEKITMDELIKPREQTCVHQTRGWVNKRIRNIFQGMKRRCYDPKTKMYYRYGGRGIKICDLWLKQPLNFERWSLANGYDDTLTIDRINNDGDYSPDNCRWITNAENSKTSSMPVNITIGDVTDSLRGWAIRLGIIPSTVYNWHREYGKSETKNRLEKYMDSSDKNSLEWSRAHNITINDRTMSVSQWAKTLGMCPSSLNEYLRNHGLEKLVSRIRDRLDGKYVPLNGEKLLTVGLITLNLSGWDKLLNFRPGTMSYYRRKYDHDVLVEKIRFCLRGEDSFGRFSGKNNNTTRD